MMRKATVFVSLLLFGAAGCADLNVTNPNEPDTRQVLADPTDLQALIGNSFFQFWDDYVWETEMALSSAAHQHATIAANFGMVHFSTYPREGTDNTPAWSFRTALEAAWRGSYNGAKAAYDGIVILEGEPAPLIGPEGRDNPRALAFAYFVLGLTHGNLAMTYDQAFVLDPAEDLEGLEMLPYPEVMSEALRFLTRSIEIAQGNAFSVPGGWLGLESAISSARLAEIAHGYRARFRAHEARGPDATVDWQAVMSDASAFQSDFIMFHDQDPFWHWAIIYKTFNGWSNAGNHHLGMADQSGEFQQWYANFMTDPVNLPRQFRILTPDLRFPQGATIDEQDANPGIYYSIDCGTCGVRPERGTWRWSWYRDHRNDGYVYESPQYVGYMPEMTVREMRLLMAEGHYRQGNRAGAAAIVNETRVPAGLNATNADGANGSCVPRVPPTFECGGLLEMIKWEKRHETRNHAGAAGYFFDSRRWGDLPAGTALHLPVPATELQVLDLPLYNFGGIGGPAAAPAGTYGY
jgi:starch-binding outer membrane protein, SusD/RagB family